MHRIENENASWAGANRKLVDGTDKDLAAAEDYRRLQAALQKYKDARPEGLR